MKTSLLIFPSLFLLLAMLSTAVGHEAGNGVPAKGFAPLEEKGGFQLYDLIRHRMGDNEIQIEIQYAGICHSELHHAFADWEKEEYPMVPGHEIVGRVVKVGKNVKKFQVGDYAGIGCMVGSCRKCDACEHHREQYCPDVVQTYHDKDPAHNNETTQGGYSNSYVLAEDFAIKVPADAEIEKVAPLFCAGITTYSPIRFAGVKKGDKVGIAGYGGLGHRGVQYAVA